MLNSREGNISYGIFHIGLSQLGRNAACLFPKMIQQETGSGKSMGDVVLLFLERDSKFFPLQRLIRTGPDRSALKK